MRWLNILHAYQPPDWDPAIVRRVAKESYGPLASFLLDHPTVKITLNVAGSLTEQLVRCGLRDVLRSLRRLLERGQIELMTMPKYHPLIPLASDEEVERQVRANDVVNRSAFGGAYQPRGFFPPELAVGPRTGRLIERLGPRWALLDELACGGVFGAVAPEQCYHWSGTDVRVLFRHRRFSDFLAFEFNPSQVQGFAAIARLHGFTQGTLVTAMDAENLGHHRPGAERAWQALITQPDVETLTVSEYLRFPGKLTSIVPVPTSWSTDDHDLVKGISYPLWAHPGNPVHQALRSLAQQTREALLVHHNDRRYTEARERFDRALASDVFWWASMRPWWDAAIVRREAAEFPRALEPLALKPNPVAAAWDAAQATIDAWERSGRAAAERARYLDDHRATRFFGGQHIT